MSAVGQAIGISPDTIEQVDLDRMVTDAIAVKEGHLDKVPQSYMFLVQMRTHYTYMYSYIAISKCHSQEGIWPPELVPLFQRDGHFPEWVDADEFRHSIRTTSSLYNNFESTPGLSLSTYVDGRLHRSLHSTSSNSSSWRRMAADRNNNVNAK
jgi:hypothetical protein